MWLKKHNFVNSTWETDGIYMHLPTPVRTVKKGRTCLLPMIYHHWIISKNQHTCGKFLGSRVPSRSRNISDHLSIELNPWKGDVLKVSLDGSRGVKYYEIDEELILLLGSQPCCSEAQLYMSYKDTMQHPPFVRHKPIPKPLSGPTYICCDLSKVLISTNLQSSQKF